MASGAYLSEHTDLALGLNSKMPPGFHRSYTSAACMQKVDREQVNLYQTGEETASLKPVLTDQKFI